MMSRGQKEFSDVMTFRLEDIPAEGLTEILEIPAPAAREALALDTEENLKLAQPLKLELHLQIVGDRLMVKGKGRVSAILACDRCLGEFTRKMAFNLNEPLKLIMGPVDKKALNNAFADQDNNDQADCSDLTVKEGRVDLWPLISECFWLTYPFQAICRPECLGLCSNCGADLNISPCRCSRQGSGSAMFQVLSGLIIKN